MFEEPSTGNHHSQELAGTVVGTLLVADGATGIDVGSRVGPLADHGADETLGLAVSLWPAGSGGRVADVQRGGHGFLDEEDLLCAGLFGRILHRPLLHLGDAGGDADDHHQAGAEEAVVGLQHLDEAADHALGRLEIGDHPVLERPDGAQVLVGLAVHLHGLLAHGNDRARAAVDRHDGRFVHHHLIVVDDQGVGGAEIDGDLLGQETEQGHGAACIPVA